MFFYKYLVNKQGFFLKKLSKNLENIFSLNLQLNFTKNRQFYDQKLNIEKSNMDRSRMYSILKSQIIVEWPVFECSVTPLRLM